MQDNTHKIILDLCGGTGAWSKPYKDAGYDVRVITLPKYDLYNAYIECTDGQHWLIFPSANAEMAIPVKQIYGILFAPTCTQFSLARTTAKTPRDLLGGFKLVQTGLDIIHYCMQHGKLKFWAIENPMGYLRKMLGRPPLTFNPCDYGDPYTKKTDLWGFYNAPRKKPVALTAEQKEKCAINNRDLPEIPAGYVLPDDIGMHAIRRSITAAGFANQFYKANK